MTEQPLRVLMVDDDETFRRVFGEALEGEGFAVQTASDGIHALETMQRRTFDLALIDLRMTRMDGLSLLDELQRRHSQTVPLVLTGFGSVPVAVDAMRRGAADVVSKSAPIEQIVAAMRGALRERIRSRAGTGLEEALFDHESYFGMVGRSAAMKAVFATIDQLRDSDRPALVCGESGTGKELVVRALHASGLRAKRPIVAINCASLRENFVENELFGHVRGAFTGAVAAKPGLFEFADGGSLHIDEIGELPAGAQASLLRVLETGRYRPLGGLEEVKADVRVIASTNRDLDRMMAEETFRNDLFYRLCVSRIDLPPLRDRPEDIPLLVNYFLDSSPLVRKRSARLEQDAVDALMAYDWPGNVRELLNTLENAVLTAEGGVVKAKHLALRSPRVGGGLHATTTPRSAPRPEGDPTLEELERGYVRELWQRTGGNITEVARILAVDPTTIRRKLRRWGEKT